MTKKLRVLVKAEMQKRENIYTSYTTEIVRFMEAVSRSVKLVSCLWELYSSFHIAIHCADKRYGAVNGRHFLPKLSRALCWCLHESCPSDCHNIIHTLLWPLGQGIWTWNCDVIMFTSYEEFGKFIAFGRCQRSTSRNFVSRVSGMTSQ